MKLICTYLLQLPNDMVNYIEYQIMGHASQILMKPGCVPSKFDCQPDRRKRTTSTERPYIVKKQRMMTVQECLNESVVPEQIPQPSCSGTQSTLIDYASRASTGTLKSKLIHSCLRFSLLINIY